MTDALMSSLLTTPLYASAAMRALMSDQARLQRMLDFEAALARAEAAVGVVTATGAVTIAEVCDAANYDIAALVEAQVPSGNIAIAVVGALTKAVAARDPLAAGFVHWGATSQDMIDTALMLELRAAIDALVADLDIAVKGFAALAGRHRRTLAVARTLMQQALPMPFGLKLAGYAAALARSRERLIRLRREAIALQFGGAAGTLAALGEHGFAVADRLAALLNLPLPDAPWHTHRDRLSEIASAFGILAGTCGKIARDVTLMMQTEVGEAFEPAASGRGGSSTLPHKRNPVGAAAALSAASVAPNLVATLLAAQVQEHERSPGGWHTDWMTIPALALATSGALAAVTEIAQGMEIDVERLRANLEMTGGQIMAEAVSFALAEKIGRAEAHALVRELSQKAMQEERSFKEVLLADLRVKSQLGGIEIEKLFIPLTYQGSAQTFIDRLVVSSQLRTPRRPDERRAAPRVEPQPEPQPESRTEPAPALRIAESRLPTAPRLPSPAEPAATEPPAEVPAEASPAAKEPVTIALANPPRPGSLIFTQPAPRPEAPLVQDPPDKFKFS
jgi:3-carboxy-cis,cis-muconate cycloisomerase